MPVSSERQVTANVRTRKRRLLLERVLFELLDEAIRRLITLFKSCTRASLRRSPFASCLMRKWISPMSQSKGVDDEVLPSPLLFSTTFACFHVPGTANAFIFFGFAFECIIDTFDENALIRGITRGKYSFELLLTGLNGEIDKAACTGGINSLRSAIPFHDFTDTTLECDLPLGLYLHEKVRESMGPLMSRKKVATKSLDRDQYVFRSHLPC